MKTPRYPSNRLALLLALGCALLTLAVAPSAQAQIKVVPLSADKLDKMSKLVQIVTADPAAKTAVDESNRDETVMTAMMNGGSINDTINTKFPKAAAVYKKAGTTPDEILGIETAASMAATGSTDGVDKPEVAKANVEFYNKNKDTIDKLLAGLM